MTSKKHKTLTRKEVTERRCIKKELQKSGLIPPDKKRLNRKKFCAEAEKILEDRLEYGFYPYLYWALGEMLNKRDFSAGGGLSQEAVGAAKVIHLAVRRRTFEAERDGKPYKIGELFDAVKDIYEA